MRPLSSRAIAAQNETKRNLGVMASLLSGLCPAGPSLSLLRAVQAAKTRLLRQWLAVTWLRLPGPRRIIRPAGGGSPHERARQSKRGKAASVATLRGDGPAGRREPGGGDLRGRSALSAAGRAIWGHRNGPGRERADHLSEPGDHVRAINGIRSR